MSKVNDASLVYAHKPLDINIYIRITVKPLKAKIYSETSYS